MSFPAPPSMLSAFRFPLLLPKYQFHSLWVFMRLAMTFHLGGLDIKALLFLELGRAGDSSTGADMSRRDSQSAILLNLPSPHTPAHCRPRPPAGSLSSTGAAVTTGLHQGPFLPSLGYTKDLSSPALESDVRLLEDRLGQKTGCKCDNQDTGWVCQTPNYQARISANKARWLS